MAEQIDVKVVLTAIDDATRDIAKMKGTLDDLAKSQKQMAGAQKEAAESGSQLSGANESLMTSFFKAQIVVDAFYKSINLIKTAITSSIDAYAESEQVLMQTQAVFKSTASAQVGTYEKIKTGAKQTATASKELNDQLEGATARLHDMQKQAADGKPDTESFTVALKRQKEQVEELQAKVGATTDVYITKFKPAVRVTIGEVIELSKSLQRQTTYSDEAVLSAENLLLTFTNITKDTFPEAITTVLDMSTALGQDLKSSSIQLGKALQDPILGVTALRRVGVNFSEDQTKVIEKLVDTGKSLEAQKMILKELNLEFGGSAAAAADTYRGRMEKVKNTINDLQESIGKTITEQLNPLIDRMQKFADSKDAQKMLDELNTIIIATSKNMGMAAEALGQLSNQLGTDNIVLDAFIGSLKILAVGIAGLSQSVDLLAFGIESIIRNFERGQLAVMQFIAMITGQQNALAIINQQIAAWDEGQVQMILSLGERTMERKALIDGIWAGHLETMNGVQTQQAAVCSQMSTNVTNMSSKVQSTVGLMSTNVPQTLSTMNVQSTGHVDKLKQNTIQLTSEMQSKANASVSLLQSGATQSYQTLKTDADTNMSSIYKSTVNTSKSIESEATPIWQRIKGWLSDLRSAAESAWNSITKVNNTSGQKRQFGGAVSSSNQYTVGEAGVEQYVPQSAGYINPAGKYENKGAGGGGGPTIQFIINADMIINSPGERRGLAEALYKDLVTLAQSMNMSVAEMMGG